MNFLPNCPFPYNQCGTRFIVSRGLCAGSQHARNQHLQVSATYKTGLYDVMGLESTFSARSLPALPLPGDAQDTPESKGDSS